MALSPTANQGARPNPAYSNAQHASEKGRADHDSNSPSKFLAGKGIPTSGGRADDTHGTVDHTHDQGSKKLYLGKAYENADSTKVKPFRAKGNSEGRAEINRGDESDAHIQKAASARLSKSDEASNRLVVGNAQKPFAGIPFRKSSPAFGPFGKKAPVMEHESAGKF